MMTLAQLNQRFGTEEACLDYLVLLRWPSGVCCPRCGNEKVYKLGKPYRWLCKLCQKNGYRFSPLVRTIFENTNYPLTIWFQVIYLMCQSKKGMSALQIHRTIGSGSYRTAWYMCHRIRAAMEDREFHKLMGEVEVDETWIGGNTRNMHEWQRKAVRGQPRTRKAPVVGAIARKGKVVAKMVEDATAVTLNQFVSETVSENVSLVATDQHAGYVHLRKLGFPHETVNHFRGEYVRGVVHTANLDSFWALLKRGMVGTFHQVSKRYLPLYLAEFTYRHNRRNDTDLFEQVIAAC
jgi:transposase-like protein